MDINQSTAVGNVDAIESLLGQAAVGDPNQNPGVNDIKNHVLLVHGDLGTGERVENFQESRSIEKTSCLRFQFVVFVMGLFHLQMACIDAIWRILLKPKNSQIDPDCLLERVGVLHPKQTVKISKNPKFRQMHNIVLQDGIASRLDVWRVVAAKQNTAHSSLKAFAESKPSWSTILAMSKQLPKEYVASGNFSARRRKPDEERDKVHENALLKNRYYLLYEELIYGMNNGDIGRVENCFIPWIFIFKATGKNKYASHMTRFLLDLNYVFPESLRKAIRMNWLGNPSGKPGKYRGNDWIMELNNFYTKACYGGRYSNRSVKRILEESPLIEVYRKLLTKFEEMFYISGRTILHAPTLIKNMILKLLGKIDENQPHVFEKGRDVEYSAPDSVKEGVMLMSKFFDDVAAGEAFEGGDDGNEMDDLDTDDLVNCVSE
ncbi:hypothetical protein SCHPADRAFT_823226 [Schizopora paradoxa]|uniref:DUF6589 domain-containing protein n=1 Tax=Schizopora paradoxa TaxID=27342 RepID=A0A0H2RXU1_9AGAM|nr:hypothetical protein SCHPADRAFT_823226 [Schizopora paradoxa]